MDLSLTTPRRDDATREVLDWIRRNQAEQLAHRIFLADFHKGRSSIALLSPLVQMANDFGVDIDPNLIIALRNYESLSQLRTELRKVQGSPVSRVLLTGGSAPVEGTIKLWDAMQVVREQGLLAGTTLSPLWWSEVEMAKYMKYYSPDFVVTELVLDWRMLNKVLVTTRDIETTVALPYLGNGTFVIRGGQPGLFDARTNEQLKWSNLDEPIYWDEETGTRLVKGRFPHNVCLLPDGIVRDGKLHPDALMDSIALLEQRLQEVKGRKYPLRSWLRVASGLDYEPLLERLTLFGNSPDDSTL